MKEFSESLKEIRKDQGYSQKELGLQLGIGQTTIANYEKGLRFPSQEILISLADFFNISVDILLGLQTYHVKLLEEKKYSEKQIKLLKKRLFQELMNENEQEVYDLFDMKLFQSTKGSDLLIQIYEEVITPTMYRVGTIWQNGEISVAKEHYITGIIYKIIANLSMEMSRGLKNARLETSNLNESERATVICMSLSSEPHTLGMQMITDYFTVLGYKPYYVGSGVPTDALYNLIDKINPEVIAISATMKYHLDSVINLIELIKRHTSQCKIVVGGQGFEGVSKEKVGADIIASQFKQLREELKGG